MTDFKRLQTLLSQINPHAILVTDSSVLIANPDLRKWILGYPAVVVVSNLVLGELERRKTARTQDPDAADSANAVMLALATASTEQRRELADGVLFGNDTWFVSVPVDRAKLARGLDAKQNDQQIAGVAGIVAELTYIPTILLTGDINQKVFASSVAIPAHLQRRPFDEPTALRDLVSHLRATHYRSTPTEPLDSNLPPKESIVTNFVGRQHHLAALEGWFMDLDARKWALTGDGGKGKTAIAYTFAESVALAAPLNIVNNVIWLSAKRRRYLEGTAVAIAQPDFSTLDEALDALLRYFNDTSALSSDTRSKRRRVREWLTDFPSLVVIDDLDSIDPREEDAAEFFLEDVLRTQSKVLLTSRRHYPAMGHRETEVRGLEGEEARIFVETKAAEFGLAPARFQPSLDRILQVTEGSPLYIEDLLRLCHVSGVGDALHQWKRRRGESARRYALEREVEELTRSSSVDREVLIACALAGGPVTTSQLTLLCNQERDDVEQALEHLRQFYLMPAPSIIEDVVWFDLNRNTRAQIIAQFGNSDDARRIRGALVTLGNQPAERRFDERIAAAARESRLLAWSKRWSDAETLLRDAQGRFGEHHEILQALGWLYSRWEPRPRVTEAREVFERAHQLGSTIPRLYWDWALMEQQEGEFRRAVQVAELGLLRFHRSLDLRLRQVEALGLLADQLERRVDHEGAVAAWRNAVSVARDSIFIPAANVSSQRLKRQLFNLGLRSANRVHDTRGTRELREARGLLDSDQSVPASPHLNDARLRTALSGVVPQHVAGNRELAVHKTLEVLRALQSSADFVDTLKVRGIPIPTVASAIGYAVPGFDAQHLGYTSLMSYLQATLNGSPFQLARPSISVTAEPRLVTREPMPEGFVPLPDVSSDQLLEDTVSVTEAGEHALRMVREMTGEARFALALEHEGIKVMDFGKALSRDMPAFAPARYGFQNLTGFLQYVLTGTEYCVAQDLAAPPPARSRICLRSSVPSAFELLPDA